MDDLDLLGEFICDQSQDTFTALVQRHLNLVHCAGLRQVRSPQFAKEVAQCVFAKRGVTIGASGLAIVISANAVQAAPAGLALTISSFQAPPLRVEQSSLPSQSQPPRRPLS